MDTLYIIPHTHYDAEVFLPREDYLEVGYKVIFDVLHALRSDPDYRFTLDQSAFIAPFLDAYPELRESFQEMVNCGRLELVGGMHVMSDLNVASGESIIRQFVQGKGFFSRELGVEVKTGWMIDTFGHCLQMPQIMRKCGFDQYVFSRAARVSSSEFFWQGIDGSRILTHWMPLHYGVFCGAPARYEDFCEFVLDKYRRLKPFAASGAIAAPEGGDFSYPVRYDTEFARRWNADSGRPFNLAVGTPAGFFAELKRDTSKLPVVTDDFNPVFQGCYSARISMKQQNRLMEGLLYEAEAFNAVALCYGGKDAGAQIADSWEKALFSQVHDVLGGVQMDMVYENTQKRHIRARYLAEKALESSLDTLVRRIDTSSGNTRDGSIPLIVFNPLSWERTDKASAEIAFDTDDVFSVAVAGRDGTLVPLEVKALEKHPNGAIRQARLLFMAPCPGLGYHVFRVLKNVRSPWKNPWRTGKWYGMEELNKAVLENEFIRMQVDLWKGCILSLILKKTGEEFIDPEMPYGNMLVVDEDNGDFWEIGTPLRGGANRPVENIQPLDPQQALRLSTRLGGHCNIVEGDVCTEFIFTQKLEAYDFVSHVRLYAGLPRVEIESHLTNRLKNVRYRAIFPANIRGGAITQEIPFGSLERPQGEYPAIGWSDYSAKGKGLAVLNAGLPGNAVSQDKMLLSLMKCTGFVSYGAVGGFDPSNSSNGGHEIGKPHTFRYALVPHEGDWRQPGLHRQARELEHPLIVKKSSCHSGDLPAYRSFLEIDNSQAAASAFMAQGDGFLLRVYEATGKEAKAVNAIFALPVACAAETDMLGRPMEQGGPVAVDGACLKFDLKPFEVRTFRITFA
jgi:alpha-mannosidase